MRIHAAAFQHDRRIRLYETEYNWRMRKDVHCRNLRWTVTDTCLSPDQQFLLYASINPTVHMVNPRSLLLSGSCLRK
jgi:WD repeat-containing protein 23